MITWLLVISVAVVAISGVPGLVLSRRSATGQRLAAVLNVIGTGLAAVVLVIQYVRPGLVQPIRLRWALPLGQFAVAVDDFSAVFLIPIFLISTLGSVFGMSYWRQAEHMGNGRKLRVCWGLMTAGMALVVVARDGVLLLMGWEVMALAGFFLVATEENKEEVRDAAWVYLVATHVGTLCLFGFFALLRHATGSFDLWPTNLAALPPRMATGLFILGAVGFGIKAGIMPLHVWLPGAHANAPSHVSAIMSGVLLKTGVYGLMRVAALMPGPPLWWGVTLLIAGALSAILGICYASGQRDLKRLLAYSSIENVGIIVLGLGLATLGRSQDRPDLVVLGLGGALLHVLNHSFFKPLLFMGAGGILHAAHTRQMDLLGGLGKRMPRTFVLFLVGAVAISGLPPLNGFVSELLLYIGLFKTVSTPGGWGWVGLTAPALALVGAIAVVTFVKALGAMFAGNPRSARATSAHDPDRSMLVPMSILAVCCVLIGVLPVLAVGVLDRAATSWSPHPSGPLNSIESYVPLAGLTALAVALLLTVAFGGWCLRRSRVDRSARGADTWGCGYARPTVRMQYSGSSFSQMIVALLAWALWPRRKTPRIDGVFPARAEFASDIPDVVLDRGLRPAFASAEWLLGWARGIQRGPIQVYVLYVLAILIMLLLFA
jgi:hydrogenase-4 component B